MIVRLEVTGGAQHALGRTAPRVLIEVEPGRDATIASSERLQRHAASCAAVLLEAMAPDRLERQVREALDRADRAGDSVMLMSEVAELVGWERKPAEVGADAG